ncbi:MAG: DNA-binding response regulator [Robiginitomaculum sp.]|nr:MAG: DNA-binding response regulator [Robiginitomaculum sp.]
MKENAHILVIDDHRDIRDLVGRYLRRQGFRTTEAKDAAQARVKLNAGAFDLVILDIMMPGEDGLSLCRFLRESKGPPVILLSAMAEDTDRIVGLEIGADDYLAKPFNPRELLARTRAVLRRSQDGHVRLEQDETREKWHFDRWVLCATERALLDENGVKTPLSSGEFKLLRILLNRPNQVLSRDQLLDLTQGRAAKAFDRAIDNQISRLRQKIERDPTHPTLIQTMWGDGYMLCTQVKADTQARTVS